MDVAIVVLPLIAAALAGLFGKWIGDRGAQGVTCLAMLISLGLSCYVFADVALAGHVRVTPLFTWFLSGVSAMVHIYSIGYMHGDPSIPRFMSYLSLFSFSMLMLVTADNFMQLFFEIGRA